MSRVGEDIVGKKLGRQYDWLMDVDLDQFKNPLKPLRFTPEAAKFLDEIERSFSEDFTPDRGGHFSQRSKQAIVNMASNKLSERLKDIPSPIDFETLRTEWRAVLVDYHQNNNWGFLAQKAAPKKVLTEDQKIMRQMLPYIGIVLFAAFFVKIAFFYFGMHESANPSTTYKTWFIITLTAFFGSLIYFAWRKK